MENERRKGKFDTCIQEANQFLTVAEHCLSQDSVKPCSLIYPLFVNGALSCELFMKSVMIAESNDSSFIGGHNLNKLFKGLSQEAQAKITMFYDEKFQHVSLPVLLEKYPNVFIEWRYCFEHGAEGNRLGFIILAKSIKKYIEINQIHSNKEKLST